MSQTIQKKHLETKYFTTNTWHLHLVEDVTMPVITGTIDVADGQDFRTLLPFTGMEKLELHVFTPGHKTRLNL